MGLWARIKSVAGGDRVDHTIAVSGTVNVPDSTNLVYFTGTDTVTALNASSSTRNRLVTFIQSDSGTTTLRNTNGTSTEGQMDLGGADLALGQADACQLLLRADGSWLRVSSQNN